MLTIGEKITIKDIARIAKVSPATVSLVINDRPGVGEETRYRILRIVKALRYTPNLIARSLVKRRSDAIAMLITDVRNHVFPEIAMGVEDILNQHGYSLTIVSTYDDEKLETKRLETIRARGIDGIIASAPLLSSTNLGQLDKAGFPVVCVLRRVYDCDALDYVIVDSMKGAYVAIEHLIRLGHNRIGFIKGPLNTSSGVEKLGGTMKAFKDYAISPNDTLIHDGDYSRESGYLATNYFLKLGDGQRPTAIFAANDDMAIGAFEAVLDAGMKIPEDMALVGFNDVEVTSLRTIEITTVAHPKEEMGRLGAQRLIAKVEENGSFGEPYHVVLEPKMVIRKSCGFHASQGYVIEKAEHCSL